MCHQQKVLLLNQPILNHPSVSSTKSYLIVPAYPKSSNCVISKEFSYCTSISYFIPVCHQQRVLLLYQHILNHPSVSSAKSSPIVPAYPKLSQCVCPLSDRFRVCVLYSIQLQSFQCVVIFEFVKLYNTKPEFIRVCHKTWIHPSIFTNTKQIRLCHNNLSVEHS